MDWRMQIYRIAITPRAYAGQLHGSEISDEGLFFSLLFFLAGDAQRGHRASAKPRERDRLSALFAFTVFALLDSDQCCFDLFEEKAFSPTKSSSACHAKERRASPSSPST